MTTYAEILRASIEANEALDILGPDPVRGDWSSGRLLREVLAKIEPLGVLDDYERLHLQYISRNLDVLDEEHYGLDGMGEV